MGAIRILGCIGCIGITSLGTFNLQIAEAKETKAEVIQEVIESSTEENKDYEKLLKDEYPLRLILPAYGIDIVPSFNNRTAGFFSIYFIFINQ